MKGYEARLSQEDTIPADPAAIQCQEVLLQVRGLWDLFLKSNVELVLTFFFPQQWKIEAAEKDNIISLLEEDVAKAREVRDRLNQKTQDRNLDVDQYQEKTSKLRERWSGVHTQMETRFFFLVYFSFMMLNYSDAFSLAQFYRLFSCTKKALPDFTACCKL